MTIAQINILGAILRKFVVFRAEKLVQEGEGVKSKGVVSMIVLATTESTGAEIAMIQNPRSPCALPFACS